MILALRQMGEREWDEDMPQARLKHLEHLYIFCEQLHYWLCQSSYILSIFIFKKFVFMLFYPVLFCKNLVLYIILDIQPEMTGN